MSEALRVRRAEGKEGASHAPDGPAHAPSSAHAHASPSAASVSPSLGPAWAAVPAAPVLTLGPVQRKPDASAAAVQRVEIGQADDAKEREADAVADAVVPAPEPPASAGVQRKPVIGAPGDAYEREADAVADRISAGLDAPAFGVTRLGPAGPAGPPRAPAAAEAAAPIVPVAPVQPVQAMAEEEKQEEVLPAPSVQAMEIASADQEPPDAPASSGASGSPIQRKEAEEKPDSIQLAADEEMEEAPPPPAVQAMEAAPADQEPPDEPPPPDDVPIQRKNLQRKEMDEDEPVQLDAAGPASASASTSAASSLTPAANPGASPTPSMSDAAAAAIASPGPGAPLPAGTRGALEPRLGIDLGGVRVHDDADAHRSAAALHARAFTHGRHIWLGRGESAGDVRLMAHEVTHVLQQDGVVRRKPAEKKAPKKSSGSGDAGSAAPPAPAPAAPAPAPKAESKAPSSPDALREPQMPPPPEELSAAEKARLNKVEERAEGAVDATTDLPAAEEQVGDARGAVQEPQAETKARAGDQLVEALDQRPAPSPEIEQLCKDIRKAIKAKRPPDEDSLVKAKPKDMAQQAGSQMNASVEGDAQRVQGQYDQLQAPPAGTPEKTAEPLPPPPGPAETPALGAAGAAPSGVPAEKVSLDADVEAGAKQMEEAGMESEPAKLVQDGPIAEARAAQGELAETAARDPQEVLAEQKDVLAGAQNDMAALQASALAALKTGRSKTTEEGRSQQTGMVGSEEEMRTKAGADAQAIFDSAQKRVNDLLTPLPKTAMAKWEAGVKVLSTEFEQTLSKVKKWIDDRHESTVLAVWDAVTGLPGWVTDEYDRAELKFGDGVCALIREISTEVNGVIAACETIIDTSRKDIDAVFAKLPAELQGWAAEQQASFGKQLDGLADKAQKTKSDFTKELTEKAASAVQEVRQKVHALREAAKGLLGKLADAVNAFLEDPAKFIIDGLLKLVGIAPSAFWALVDRIGQAIDAIADDPMNFVNNLMAALGKGFSQFFDNIGSHLLKGLLEWLFSGLGSVGVTIPSDLSLKSIITFFLQLMGLSWANIRKILAKHIGEKNVALIEKAWELVSMLIEKGPEGIFELIQEQLDPANLLSMVLEAATEYLITALIKAVTPRILLMFNPAGAIIQAIEAIFRVLSWVFNNAAKIFSLVETIVNGVTDLIAGNIGGMANAIETGLAKLIPPVIDFLASYLGLGDLPEAIAGVIKGFQKQVLAIVDKIIGFLAKKAADLLKKLGLGGKDEKGAGAEGVLEKDFSAADGSSHELTVDTTGDTPVIRVASVKPVGVQHQINDRRAEETDAKNPRPLTDDQKKALDAAWTHHDKLVVQARRLHTATDPAEKAKITTEIVRLMDLLTASMVAGDAWPSGEIEPTKVSFGPSTGNKSVVASPLTRKPGDTVGSAAADVIPGWNLNIPTQTAGKGGTLTWRRVHLLPDRLHGPGSNPANLVPGDAGTNSALLHGPEMAAYNRITKGETLEYTASVTGPDPTNPFFPGGLQVSVTRIKPEPKEKVWGGPISVAPAPVAGGGPKLTRPQAAVLAVYKQLAAGGKKPTLAEIAAKLGRASLGSLSDTLADIRALVKDAPRPLSAELEDARLTLGLP